MQLLFLFSFNALMAFFQSDFKVPDKPQTRTDAALCLGVKVRVKVFLQGPYAGASLMNSNLRTLTGPTGFPTTEPYSSAPYYDAVTPNNSIYKHVIGGNEMTTTTVLANTSIAIVDWVFLELRDKTTPTTVLATRSALLKANGYVVDVDGSSDVTFSTLDCGEYYVVVRQRNHLGVRTRDLIPLSATATELDFTSTLFVVDGTDTRQDITLAGGVPGKALAAGDTDADKTIGSLDRDNAWNDRLNTGYVKSDCDLDGSLTSLDRDIIWNNRGKTSLY